MHPLIRVLCLVALAIGLAAAAPAALLSASLLIAALVGATGAGAGVVLGALRRLRWLLISVLVLYAWLLPGDPLLERLADWSPTRQGLLAGLNRAWMLLVMATAARLLMELTPRDHLLAALHTLLKPLRRVKLNPARFCLRLVLTLEYALADRGTGEDDARDDGRPLVQRAAALARDRLARAERRAERAELGDVRIPLLAGPTLAQWLVPAMLLAALLVLSGL